MERAVTHYQNHVFAFGRQRVCGRAVVQHSRDLGTFEVISLVYMTMASMPSIVLQVILLCLAYSIASFVVKLYHMRSRFQRMQKEGLVSHHTNQQPYSTSFQQALLRALDLGREGSSTDIMIHPANATTSPDLWTSPRGRRNHV